MAETKIECDESRSAPATELVFQQPLDSLDQATRESGGLADIFKTVAPLLTVTIASLYGIGVLVTNAYLLSIGINDFNLFRARCILTGTWATGVLFFLSLPAITLLSICSATKGRYTRKRMLELMLAGTVIGAAGNWTLLAILGVPPHLKNAVFYLGGELLLVLPAGLNISVNYLHKRRGPPKPGYPKNPGKIGVTTLAIGVILLTIVAIGRLAYPAVSPVFGGGKPQRATLVLSRDGVLVWKELKLSNREDAPETLLTSEVEILYDTQSEFAIRVTDQRDRTRILTLDKKLVLAVAPKPLDFL